MTDRLVHVVDDDPAFRESVVLMLEACGLRTLEYGSGEAFLGALGSSVEGCALLDVAMPGLDGLAVQDALAARRLDLPVIVMTGRADVPLAVRAMKAGAVDFIEKPFTMETLRLAVDAALSRARTPPDPELAAFRERLAGLTAREREVLQGIVAGWPTKVIAHRLGISPRTVDAHRVHIGEKLAVTGLPNLIRLALAAGAAQPLSE